MTEEIKDPEGLLKAYNKAKEDLVALRAELAEVAKAKDALDAEREQISGAVEKWKKTALDAKALASLQEQGIKDPERILKYVKLDGVDLDDEGNVTGLDDNLKTVKSDFPELFDVKRRAARTSVDIHADRPAEKPKTGTEAQVERLFANK